MADVDKILNTPPGQALANEDQDMGNTLADLDPIFASPIGASPDAGKPTKTKQPYDYSPEVVGGGAGAVVGAMAGKYENPKLTGAKAAFSDAAAVENAAKGQLVGMQGSRLNAMDAAQLAVRDAQAEVSAARQALTQAEASAVKAGVPIAQAGKGPENWTKAMGKDVPAVVAATAENMRKDNPLGGQAIIDRDTAAKQKINQIGAGNYKMSGTLMLPDKLSTETNAVRLEAENALSKAKEAHEQAIKRAADLQVKQEAVSRPTRVETNMEGTVRDASRATVGKQAAVEELKKARSILSKIPGFNLIMGSLSGAELVHAYRQLEAGNTMDAVMAGLSGAGGLISMAPHPVAKAVGTAMTIPGLAYQGYKEAKERGFEMPTVNPMGN